MFSYYMPIETNNNSNNYNNNKKQKQQRPQLKVHLERYGALNAERNRAMERKPNKK